MNHPPPQAHNFDFGKKKLSKSSRQCNIHDSASVARRWSKYASFKNLFEVSTVERTSPRLCTSTLWKLYFAPNASKNLRRRSTSHEKCAPWNSSPRQSITVWKQTKLTTTTRIPIPTVIETKNELIQRSNNRFHIKTRYVHIHTRYVFLFCARGSTLIPTMLN